MILLLSELSPTTLQILNWLNCKSESCTFIDYRIHQLWALNVEDMILKSMDFLSIEGDICKIDVSEIKSYMVFHGDIVYPNINKGRNVDEYDYHTNLIEEFDTVKGFIEQSLSENIHIGTIGSQDVNKLNVLNIARFIGIDIPNTYVITGKEALITLINNNNDIFITKALASPITSKTGRYTSIAYSSILGFEEIANLSDIFFPSLIQQYIKKEFELRIVFLNGEFFSSAIISQNNEQTSVDYRRYDLEKPNRVLPYKLPSVIEKKLTLLMEKLKLNFGSIDMIYSKDDKYVFLEVNPVGQFGFVSSQCNYHIEKHIANFLSN